MWCKLKKYIPILALHISIDCWLTWKAQLFLVVLFWLIYLIKPHDHQPSIIWKTAKLIFYSPLVLQQALFLGSVGSSSRSRTSRYLTHNLRTSGFERRTWHSHVLFVFYSLVVQFLLRAILFMSTPAVKEWCGGICILSGNIIRYGECRARWKANARATHACWAVLWEGSERTAIT